MAEDSVKWIARARKRRPAGLVELLRYFDATVQRLSLALCGEARLARRTVRRVRGQALEAAGKFRDLDDAQRWFLHHTILESREHLGRVREDALLAADTRTDDWFGAFVRALRHLPVQQREAIVLHYGERLNPRYLGVAMDCSMEAATTHLNAAKSELVKLAGHQWEELQQRFSEVYKRLAKPSDDVVPEIRRRVARYIWPRRIGRLLVVCVMGVVVWGIWSLRHWVVGVLK